MATTTKSRVYLRSFCIEPQTINAIWALVQEDAQDHTVVFSCSDGSKITASDLDSLLRFPNTAFRRITSIELSNGRKSIVGINVSMDTNWAGAPKLSYEIVGDDKSVLYVSGRLDELIGSATMWYSPFTPGNYGPHFALWMAMLFLSPACLVIGLPGLLGYTTTPETLSRLWSMTIAGIGAILLLLIFIGARVARALFPPAIFLIGNGAQVAARAAWFRRAAASTLVGGGLLVGVVAGVIANWLSM